MKRIYIIFLLLYYLVLSGCSKDNSEIILPDDMAKNIEHSTTGWELYSWQVEDQWNYSILIGTNRIKSYEEVTTSRILVIGEQKLKEILKTFPEKELVTWIGEGWLKKCWQTNYKNLELPPEIIINGIRQYCTEIKIVLNVTD